MVSFGFYNVSTACLPSVRAVEGAVGIAALQDGEVQGALSSVSMQEPL